MGKNNIREKTCFVIMGYGVKQDYFTGRELDLDKTYEEIIKPMIEDLNIKCIRCDEVRHSGIIDDPMYEELLSADIVVADLSTYNANVFYELGIRHALKPYTTVIISEKELKYPFDINHIAIYTYEHLGKDIGYSEVNRFKKEMTECITEILSKPAIDSPVYTYLKINPPKIDQKSIDIADNNENEGISETLRTIIDIADKALENNEFNKAKEFYNTAYDMDKSNESLLQKSILCTYKSQRPDKKTALINALELTKKLRPKTSTNVETLGLCSAIHKRLWEEGNKQEDLNSAIEYSIRGFYISNDYYNGINLAFLFNVRANLSYGDEKIADIINAKRIRKKVIEICEKLVNEKLEFRSDKYWIMATLEEAYFGLGDNEKYLKFKNEAQKQSNIQWMINTTESQISKLEKLI